MCPPRRVTGVTARSRLTGEPTVSVPSVERSRVSGDRSAEKELGDVFNAVRQTPFTEIESPSFVSAATSEHAIFNRMPCSSFSSEAMRPSPSIIPVNIVRRITDPIVGNMLLYLLVSSELH